MARALRFEELEERIAPVVVMAGDEWTFTDSDGDAITVSYDGPEGSSVEVLDNSGDELDDGEDIGRIQFTGSDISSLLLVYGANADDTLVIKDTISTSSGEDVGAIVIGYNPETGEACEVSFDDYFGVDIGGTLGVFSTSGDIDCDVKGQWIRAGGDIGMIEIDELTLNSGTGLAILATGYGGEPGDIHFIVVNDIWDSTGGGSVDPVAIPASGVTIADDVGVGTTGFVNLKLSGGTPEGYYYAVPVYGGGNVIAEVYVASDGTAVNITTSGRGGDVSYVSFDASTPGVTMSGAADSDLLYVWAWIDVGQVVNKTTGGDIGGVCAERGDHIGLIQTGKMGVLGEIFTGRGNSMPIVAGLGEAGYTTYADGDIAAIKVGSISETLIEAAGIGSLTTTGGGIWDSEIYGVYGIGSVSSKDAIVRSGIYAIDPLSPTDGGGIGSFTAPMLIGAEVVALGDIAKFTVTRGMYDSLISTYIDDGAGGHIGGGIASLSVGGMSTSTIETNHGITSAKIGASGIFRSTLWAHEGLTSVQVAGDVLDSAVGADWSFGSLKIGGDVMQNSWINANSAASIAVTGNLSESGVELGAGSSGAIQIGGNIVGGRGIYVEGDVASIAIKGYVFAEDDEKIGVVGHAGAVTIGGSVHNAHLGFGSAGAVKVGGSMMGGVISAQTALGAVSIGRSMYESAIMSNGSAGAITVKGMLCDSVVAATGSITSITLTDMFGVTLAAGGNIGFITVKAGDVSGADNISIDGNLGGMKVAGVIAGPISVGGDLTGSILSAGNDAVLYGGTYYFTDANGQMTGAPLTVGGTIAPGVVIS